MNVKLSDNGLYTRFFNRDVAEALCAKLSEGDDWTYSVSEPYLFINAYREPVDCWHINVRDEENRFLGRL
jgi:hypothetical protein